jgi:hypothetical protein
MAAPTTLPRFALLLAAGAVVAAAAGLPALLNRGLGDLLGPWLHEARHRRALEAELREVQGWIEQRERTATALAEGHLTLLEAAARISALQAKVEARYPGAKRHFASLPEPERACRLAIQATRHALTDRSRDPRPVLDRLEAELQRLRANGPIELPYPVPVAKVSPAAR